jgi:hypothetical protein
MSANPSFAALANPSFVASVSGRWHGTEVSTRINAGKIIVSGNHGIAVVMRSSNSLQIVAGPTLKALEG